MQWLIMEFFKFDMIYTNDLDHGSYISDTLKIDPTSSQLRSFSRNISNDASW